jgi:hypothetical protein
MIRHVINYFFVGLVDQDELMDQPLDHDIVAELDNETLHWALLDATAGDRQVLWAEIERRRLCV